jgi:sulfopyruvate decarboxylase alpha subunit
VIKTVANPGLSQDCLEALRAHRFDFFSGVADSTLASLIELLSNDPLGYVPAAREDLVVGMASGAYLAGRRACVLMQNSGIGYCLNALTSLNMIYKIPLLMIIGYRGYDGKDAPEHWVMGKHCTVLLEAIGVKTFVPEAADLPKAIAQASELMNQSRLPVAVFVRPGMI